MTSAHSFASFTNSCIVQPRNPSTHLPSSHLERTSVGVQENIDIKRKSSRRKGTREKVINSYQASPSLSQMKKKSSVSFSLAHEKENTRYENIEHENDTECGNNSVCFDTSQLKTLIDDDDRFFQHLQVLKHENEKTLNTLKRLYDRGKKSPDKMILTKDGRSNLENVNESYARSITQSVNESYVTRDYLNTINEGNNVNRYDQVELSSGSSEDELDRELKVKVPQDHTNILPEQQNESLFRGRESSYDVISNMWENFSVDEYAPYKREKKEKNIKDWSPTITIPEPFTMTRREERKVKTKSKRVQQIEEEKLIKQLAEDAELQKRTTPVPIPPSTFLPLYDELAKHQEKKREYIKYLSKEILKSSEKPFSFTKREEAKKNLKNTTKRIKSNNEKNKQEFKANPYPEGLFDLTLADKIAEEEEYRKIKIKLRAEEMLASSSLPMNMKVRGSMKHYPARDKTKRVKEELKKRSCTFKPKIHHDIPDFEILQKKFEHKLEEKKQFAAPTICEPFNLKTADITSRRSKFRESVESKKISKRPQSSQGRPQTSQKRPQSAIIPEESLYRSSCNPSINTMRRSMTESPSYRLTETARLRQELQQDSKHRRREDDVRRSVSDQHKQQELQRLRKLISKKAKVHDPSRNRPTEFKEKMKSFKEADESRKKEYRLYLKEVDTKLQERPLLFERASQTNAKLKAQRRYEEILRDAGIQDTLYDSMTQDAFANDGDVVSNDGSYTPGRKLDHSDEEDNISNDGSYCPDDERSPGESDHGSLQQSDDDILSAQSEDEESDDINNNSEVNESVDEQSLDGRDDSDDFEVEQ